MNCRTCGGSNLTKFLDLGFTPPADRFLREEQLLEAETHYPLAVLMCEHCGLAQLNYVVAPELLYQQDYPYEASITRTGTSGSTASASVRRYHAPSAASLSKDQSR